MVYKGIVASTLPLKYKRQQFMIIDRCPRNEGVENVTSEELISKYQTGNVNYSHFPLLLSLNIHCHSRSHLVDEGQGEIFLRA